MDHERENESATDDGRPVDPDTGLPAEPYLEGTSQVPEQDPSPSPSDDEWSIVKESDSAEEESQ